MCCHSLLRDCDDTWLCCHSLLRETATTRDCVATHCWERLRRHVTVLPLTAEGHCDDTWLTRVKSPHARKERNKTPHPCMERRRSPHPRMVRRKTPHPRMLMKKLPHPRIVMRKMSLSRIVMRKTPHPRWWWGRRFMLASVGGRKLQMAVILLPGRSKRMCKMRFIRQFLKGFPLGDKLW